MNIYITLDFIIGITFVMSFSFVVEEVYLALTDVITNKTVLFDSDL